MNDGLFDDVSGEFALGGKGSKRGSKPVRVAFGLLLIALSAAGAVHIARQPAGVAVRGAGVTLFLSIASFGLFNVVLLRPWRWPGFAVLFALVGLFAIRIVFGP